MKYVLYCCRELCLVEQSKISTRLKLCLLKLYDHERMKGLKTNISSIVDGTVRIFTMTKGKWQKQNGANWSGSIQKAFRLPITFINSHPGLAFQFVHFSWQNKAALFFFLPMPCNHFFVSPIAQAPHCTDRDSHDWLRNTISTPQN